MRIKDVIESSDTRAGRAFDLSIQILIVLSLISFCAETVPDLPAGLRSLLWMFEIASVGIFTVEYLLRIAVADSRFGYVFSFFGLADALAILPFYVAHGLDLRAVRVVRLLRLFRILKLVRYTDALGRWRRALVMAREELVLYLSVTAMLLFLASVGIYYFESAAQPEVFGSVFHAMWWAVATFTTVGYGDVYPITVGGKIFTFFMLVLGLGVVAVPSAILASALTKVRQEDSIAERTRAPERRRDV